VKCAKAKGVELGSSLGDVTRRIRMSKTRFICTDSPGLQFPILDDKNIAFFLILHWEQSLNMLTTVVLAQKHTHFTSQPAFNYMSFKETFFPLFFLFISSFLIPHVRELRTSFQLQARSSYFSPCLLTILTWE
jgi:hypothetical protein